MSTATLNNLVGAGVVGEELGISGKRVRQLVCEWNEANPSRPLGVQLARVWLFSASDIRRIRRLHGLKRKYNRRA